MGSLRQQEVMDREQNWYRPEPEDLLCSKAKIDEKERIRGRLRRRSQRGRKKWKNVMCLKSIDGNVSRRK